MRSVLIVAVLCLGTVAYGLPIGGSVSLSFVEMEALNEQLAALASRQGVGYNPLRLAPEICGEIWPWPWLGARCSLVWASGSIQDRQGITALACGVMAASKFRLPVWASELEAGLGLCGASVSGIVEGQGWGFCGGVSMQVPIISWMGVELSGEFGFRYMAIPALTGPRGTLSLQGGPAVDFSGMLIGASIQWTTR